MNICIGCKLWGNPVWVSGPSHCEHICILTTSALIISQQQHKLGTIHPHVHFLKSIFLKVETLAMRQKKKKKKEKVDSLSNLHGVGEVKTPTSAASSTDLALHWNFTSHLALLHQGASGESRRCGVDRHHAEHTRYYQRTKSIKWGPGVGRCREFAAAGISSRPCGFVS